MRNLKRALSLALAAMMLIGMMVVSASAAAKDFTDKDEIVNDEAVNTLVTLNVIAGKGDGSYFDPTGIVTRAEMAKMITVVLNGGREPNLGNKVTPSFSDIDGHWAESYIEYCVSLGILAGRGNGKFDPDATITGSEAAKVVLIAMGYSAENSKFVGDSWEINVNATASSKGLYDDMSVVASAPLNRDNAALMVFNGLNAKMVEYDYKLNTVNGNLVTVAIAKDRNVTLLNDKFDLVTKYAYMTDASYNSEKGEYTYTLDTSATMGSAAIPAADAYGKSSYTTELDYTNLFGMKVAVLAKSTDGEVYGLFAEDSKVLATGVVGDVDVETATDTKFELADVEYELDVAANATPVWALYGADTTEKLNGITAAGYTALSLIDNDGDGKANVAVITPVTPVKVSFSSKTSFTIGAPGVDGTTHKYEDVNTGDATFAKGDILLATPKANTVDGKTAFVKAETVSGKIAAQKTGEFQIDGTWYKAAAMSGSETIALGDTVKLTVVNGYYVYAEKTSSTTTDLLVVTAKGSTTDLDGNYDAKVVFTDGTISNVKVDSDPAVGTLYTYELKDGVYKLTAATTANTGYDATVSATYDASEEKLADGTRIADDAVVIVRYGTNDVKVISGAELKKWNTDFGTTATGFANDVNGFKTAQVIVLTDSASSLPSTGDEVYGYIVSDPYAGKEDSDYYIYFDMWNGTKTVSVKDKVSGTTIAAPYLKGTLVSYTDEGNGVVDGTTAVVTTNGAVVAYDGKIVKIANSSTAVELKITDDTKIYYINTKDVAGVEGGEIAMADEVSANTYNCNVKYTVTNGDEVGVLFVDVNNKIEGSSTVSYGA